MLTLETANPARHRSRLVEPGSRASSRNRKKSGDLTCNGTSPVLFKTLHGKFQFQLQKYQTQGQGRSYFELTNQLEEGYVSHRLQKLCAYYSNRLNYEEVEKSLERVSGERLLSDQKILQIVSDKALRLSQAIQKRVVATLAPSTNLSELSQPSTTTIQQHSTINLYMAD